MADEAEFARRRGRIHYHAPVRPVLGSGAVVQAGSPRTTPVAVSPPSEFSLLPAEVGVILLPATGCATRRAGGPAPAPEPLDVGAPTGDPDRDRRRLALAARRADRVNAATTPTGRRPPRAPGR